MFENKQNLPDMLSVANRAVTSDGSHDDPNCSLALHRLKFATAAGRVRRGGATSDKSA